MVIILSQRCAASEHLKRHSITVCDIASKRQIFQGTWIVNDITGQYASMLH